MYLRKERRHQAIKAMNQDMEMHAIGMIMTNAKPISDRFIASMEAMGFRVHARETIELSKEQRDGYRKLAKQGLISKADARKMISNFRNKGQFILFEKIAEAPQKLPQGLDFGFEDWPKVPVLRLPVPAQPARRRKQKPSLAWIQGHPWWTLIYQKSLFRHSTRFLSCSPSRRISRVWL